MVVRQAYRFALDPPRACERYLAGHCGAARFAYNWGLALVKERLNRRSAGEEVEVRWTLPALRREWNRRKHRVAPWWREYSKEVYSSGLAQLAAALEAWSTRTGREARPAGRSRGVRRSTRRRSSTSVGAGT
jgi:putative transposase